MMLPNTAAAALQRLTERGYATTEPRRRIVGCFLERQEAVTAADLYTRLRGQGESIGLVTIYRTLDILREIGLVQVFSFAGNAARYEAALEKHHHLLCSTCRELTDVRASDVDDLARAIPLQSLCPGVPRGDDPVRVEHEDRVILHGLHEQPEAVFGDRQGREGLGLRHARPFCRNERGPATSAAWGSGAASRTRSRASAEEPPSRG